MEFRFNVNDVFKQPIVEIGHTLIPSTFKGDRRALWDTLSKVTDVVNAMGSASATAQSLTKPITTADRLRNSEQQTVYLLVDNDAFGGKGAVTGMLKTGKKGLYVFDREGHHYQVQSPCILDFYVHESRQRSGLGKKLFEHMLQKEQVQPDKLAIDRPSDKFLAFLQKHYNLTNPIRQMNNYVVYDGFFPETEKAEDAMINNNSETPSKHAANGLQPQITSPYGRYGAPRPPCSMGQIIHNQTSAVAAQEPSGEVKTPSQYNSTQEICPNMSPNIFETQKNAVSAPVPNAQQQMLTGQEAGNGLDRWDMSNVQNVAGGEQFSNYWPFAIPSKGYINGPGKKPAQVTGSMYQILQPDGNTDQLVAPQKVPLDSLGRPILPETPTAHPCVCPHHHHHHVVPEGSIEPGKLKHDTSLHPNNPLLQEVNNESLPYNHFSKPYRTENQQNLSRSIDQEANQSGIPQADGTMYAFNGNPMYSYNQQPQLQQFVPNSQVYAGQSGNIINLPRLPNSSKINIHPMYQQQPYGLQQMPPQMYLPDNMQQVQTSVPSSAPNEQIYTDQNYLQSSPSKILNYQNQLNNNYMQGDRKPATAIPESREEKVTTDDGDEGHVNMAPNQYIPHYNAAPAYNVTDQEQNVAPMVQNDQFAMNPNPTIDVQHQIPTYTPQNLDYNQLNQTPSNFQAQQNILANEYQLQNQFQVPPIMQQQNISDPRNEYDQNNQVLAQQLIPQQQEFNNIHSDQSGAQFGHQMSNQQMFLPPNNYNAFHFNSPQQTTPSREQAQIYPVPNNQLSRVVTKPRNVQPQINYGRHSQVITSNAQQAAGQRRYSCPPDLNAYQAQAGMKNQVATNNSHVQETAAQNFETENLTQPQQHAIIDNSKKVANPYKNMDAGGDMKSLESEKYLRGFKKVEPLIPAELRKNARTPSPVVQCPQLVRIQNHTHSNTKSHRRGVLSCRNPKSSAKKYESARNNDRVLEIR